MKNVLLVEDDRILSLLLEKQIKKIGYKVAAKVDTGEKAISHVRKHTPDLILMDIKLNGDIDGIEAICEIQSFMTVPFVYITGNSDPKTKTRAHMTQPAGYLLKPVAMDRLKEILDQVLE